MDTLLVNRAPRRVAIPAGWQEPVDFVELTLRAAGHSEASVATRVRHLRQIGRELASLYGASSPWDVSAVMLIEWAGTKQWAPETRHAYYSSVRCLFRSLGVDPSPADVLPSVARPTPLPRPTPEWVYAQALESCQGRTHMILRLAGEAGLRRAEIACVAREDVRSVWGQRSLLVHGKGGQERDIPLTESLAAEMNVLFASHGQEWLFPSHSNASGHLSPLWVAKLAGQVLPEPWSLHTLRHRFATAAYGAERDLLAVQRLLGHASVATTQRYTAPPSEAMRRAVDGASMSTRS